VDPMLSLLASFRSFFHDTIVVSSGRSSTLKSCRSPIRMHVDEGRDESLAAAESTGLELLSVIGAVVDGNWCRGDGELGHEKHE
jgi:hypothetical protein